MELCHALFHRTGAHEAPTYHPFEETGILTTTNPVVVNGTVHWITHDSMCAYELTRLLSLIFAGFSQTPCVVYGTIM